MGDTLSRGRSEGDMRIRWSSSGEREDDGSDTVTCVASDYEGVAIHIFQQYSVMKNGGIGGHCGQVFSASGQPIRRRFTYRTCRGARGPSCNPWPTLAVHACRPGPLL